VGVDYKVFACQDGHETLVADIKDNHLKFRRHSFEPVTCDALRVVFTKGVDGHTVGLYEMRAELIDEIWQ
jgi:hypothetical protein